MKTLPRFWASLFIGLVSLMLPLSCDDASVYRVWDDLLYYDLEINPTFLALEGERTATLTAIEGKPPYTFEIVSGGGTLVALGGVAEYTAPGGVETEAWIRLSDVRGDVRMAQILVSKTAIEELVVYPATATVQTGGTLSFSASGGLEPYVFRLASGSGSVDSATGVYTAPEVAATAVVVVEDASGQAAAAAVEVTTATPTLTIVPDSLVMESLATAVFTALGGDGNYTFSATAGAISEAGVFTAPDTTGTVTVTVTDGLSSSASAVVTVVAAAESLAIIPVSIQVHLGGKFQFQAAGGDGSYTYSRTAAYDDGAVDAATGSYTAPSTHPGIERVTVTDGRGMTSTATVKVRR
jgi:hypothetical protein